MAKHPLMIDYCPSCREEGKVFLSASDKIICDRCRQAIYREPRPCLRCDTYFKPISRYNRLCSVCSNRNEGIETYGQNI